MPTYKCSGCSFSDSLSKYVCTNCNKYGAMSVDDSSYPFLCSNCDLRWETLTCPKCYARITKKFISSGGSGILFIIVVGVFLYWMFGKSSTPSKSNNSSQNQHNYSTPSKNNNSNTNNNSGTKWEIIRDNDK